MADQPCVAPFQRRFTIRGPVMHAAGAPAAASFRGRENPTLIVRDITYRTVALLLSDLVGQFANDRSTQRHIQTCDSRGVNTPPAVQAPVGLVIVPAAVKGHGHARIVPDLILERDNARRLIR